MLNKTILIVEDDINQQQIYTIALQRAGYSVVARAEASSGLRWLGEILPDLIVLDVMLPGMSGIEMLHEIRNNPHGADVPIIIASASGELSAEVLRTYAIAAYLPKPLLPSELVRAIKAILPEG